MRTLLEYGLANAAAATALALLALIIGFAIRRPSVRNAMWLLVLVRLLLPPIWTIDVPNFSRPIVAEKDGGAATALESALEPAATPPPTAVAAESRDADPGAIPIGNEVAAAIDDSKQTLPTAEPPVETIPIQSQLSSDRLSAWVHWSLAGIWIAGTIFVAMRSLRRTVRFHRALRDAAPALDPIRSQAEEIARRLGLRSCPAILVVPGRLWPSLWMPCPMPRKIKLILPAGLLTVLTDEQRAAVLAHELAHLRRGDPWVRWLELIAICIYWWHPLLGWFRRKLRESEEECCDMWVIAATDGRKSYATALLETAMFLDGPDRLPAPLLASGAGPVRNLQRRVTMIMRATWPARLTRFGLVTILGIGGLGLAFGPAMAQPERRDGPARDERPRDSQPKDRPNEKPRERGEDRGREIDQAKAELEKARQVARQAMERVRDAEARLARLQGRPLDRGQPAERALPRRGAGERNPGDRGRGDDFDPFHPKRAEREPGDRRPGERVAPGPGRVPAGELQDLHRQIEELRAALEDMRREIHRDRDARDPVRPRERPKDPSRRDDRKPFDPPAEKR